MFPKGQGGAPAALASLRGKGPLATNVDRRGPRLEAFTAAWEGKATSRRVVWQDNPDGWPHRTP
jgi:hypothetical protein